MLKLQFKDQRKPAIWLVEARYAIGRDPQNNIVLADEGVSPFHAEIRIEGDQVFISDTAGTSGGGTFVNGKRIQRRTELRSADRIAIHMVELLLIDPKQDVSGAPEGATEISPALANIPIAAPGVKQGSGWVLKAKTGAIVGKSFLIPIIGKTIIGRANNCDIQLPANHVSRQHAEVQLVSGKLLVKDLNSSNGTYINRKKVSEGELKSGDEVRFDTFSFDVTGPVASVSAAVPEGDRTQFRPGVAVTATHARLKVEASSAAKPARSVNAAAAPDMPVLSAGQTKGGGGGMVVLVLFLGALAAAWYFLG